MEKVLSACLAVALVLFVVGSSLAAGESAKAVQFDRTTVTEPFNNPSSPPQTFAPPLTPQQLQSLHTNPLAIGPGTYNVGVGQTYATLSAAVSDLMASGVTGGGDVIFQFTDAAYTDTAQIIGGYAGQSPTNRVIFRPAPGVVTHILFSGGTRGGEKRGSAFSPCTCASRAISASRSFATRFGATPSLSRSAGTVPLS